MSDDQIEERLRSSEARLHALREMIHGMIDGALAGGQKIARATAALEEAVLMLLAIDAVTMSRAAELLGQDVAWTRGWYNRNADKAATLRSSMFPAPLEKAWKPEDEARWRGE